MKLLRNRTNIKKDSISLGEIFIDVIQKNIKNLHLSVHPPTGRVRISAPLRISLETIRLFAISKVAWIRKHQTRIQRQKRETPREYISGESHYFFGKRYLLKVTKHGGRPSVKQHHDILELFVNSDSTRQQRLTILDRWYRKQLKEIIPQYISKYETKMNVHVAEWGIKKMKTKWGVCNIRAQRIWLNLELCKKPLHCIEYVVVHEMVHLLERKHNERFKRLMDTFLPNWRSFKDELNQFPVSHSEWEY